MSTDRSRAARTARETLAIVESGSYASSKGETLDIAEAVRAAVSRTREYPPEHALPAPRAGASSTRFHVANESAVDTARHLAARHEDPLVLNFASAKNPGGGFLGGARAQEESLARASALYACLLGRAMYAHHRARHDAAYTSWMIHSPRVPIFRDERGALLDAPFCASMLTAPAPNAKVVLERQPSRSAEIDAIMRERIARVLSIAQHHGHRALILGAWGCGVFGNDPRFVASAFRDALRGAFAGAFDEIVFAVLDTSAEKRFIGPFEELFHE
jgi:uncharacterized protein (TIGR02452 family)